MLNKLGEAKDLVVFFRKTNKLYLVPVILLLVILGLIALYMSISPVPIFLYPII